MTKNSISFLVAAFALAIMTSGCEHMNGEAGPESSGTSPEAAPTEPPDVAHGAQDDSLEACLARIPGDASSGQKMLAEVTCKKQFEPREKYDQIQRHKRDPLQPR